MGCRGSPRDLNPAGKLTCPALYNLFWLHQSRQTCEPALLAANGLINPAVLDMGILLSFLLVKILWFPQEATSKPRSQNRENCPVAQM